MAKVAQPESAKQEPVITMWSKEFTYDRWMKTKGIPIHTGYFIPDLRTIELSGGKNGDAKRHLSSCSAKRCQRVARNGNSRRQVAAAGEICLG